MALHPIDLVRLTKKYKGGEHGFFLDMSSWKRFKVDRQLVWQKLRFEKQGHAAVPKQRGIYVFTVELAPAKLPSHGYIMYVGKTGDDTGGTLYNLYAQYLREEAYGKGRPRVVYMLMNWRKHLFFNFVALPDVSIDLGMIEEAFINAVIPPVNVRDFVATVGAPKKAAF